MTGTATKISDRLQEGDPIAGICSRATQAVYRLDPPLNGHEFVVVSSVRVMGEPEVYIFACTPHGEVTNWVELPGSLKGTLSHVQALASAGYSISVLS